MHTGQKFLGVNIMPNFGKLLGVDGTKEFMRKIHDKFGEYVGNAVFNAYKQEVTNSLSEKLNTSASADFLTKSFDKESIIDLLYRLFITGGNITVGMDPNNTTDTITSEFLNFSTNILASAGEILEFTFLGLLNSENDSTALYDGFLYYQGKIYVDEKHNKRSSHSFPVLIFGRSSKNSTAINKGYRCGVIMYQAYTSNNKLSFDIMDDLYQLEPFNNTENRTSLYTGLKKYIFVVNNQLNYQFNSTHTNADTIRNRWNNYTS